MPTPDGHARFRGEADRAPAKMVAAGRQALRYAGFSDRDIWDIASTAAFHNKANRLAAATDMKPSREYHDQLRD